jgi:hypothetical protein
MAKKSAIQAIIGKLFAELPFGNLPPVKPKWMNKNQTFF